MAANNFCWYKKVFGEELMECRTMRNDNFNESVLATELVFEQVSKRSETGDKLVVGVYFSSFEEDMTAQLVQLYQRLNTGGENSNRESGAEEVSQCEESEEYKLEVIEVCLTGSVHWLDRCSVDEAKVFAHLQDVPWYAVPFRDKDRAVRLSRRFQIKTMAPSLVLLDGKTGDVITKHGRDRLQEDPTGSRFPWAPRPVHEVLSKVQLLPGGKSPHSEQVPFHSLADHVVGFYFSAHWCPPCKGFTPSLIETYNHLKTKSDKFEIVFVSSDRSRESYDLYLSGMPWLAVPYQHDACRKELASVFGVQGIPTLVIVEGDGSVITLDGRGEINDDPQGLYFPWRWRSVNVLTERQAAKLQDNPAVVLFIEGDEAEMEFAQTALMPAAKDFHQQHEPDQPVLEFFIACDGDTGDSLREFLGVDDMVPLLTLVNIPQGTWALLEEDMEIEEATVKDWTRRFQLGQLPMQSIVRTST